MVVATLANIPEVLIDAISLPAFLELVAVVLVESRVEPILKDTGGELLNGGVFESTDAVATLDVSDLEVVVF